jgi:hypothetical protein
MNFGKKNYVSAIPTLHVIDKDLSSCYNEARNDVGDGKNAIEIIKKWRSKWKFRAFEGK